MAAGADIPGNSMRSGVDLVQLDSMAALYPCCGDIAGKTALFQGENAASGVSERTDPDGAAPECDGVLFRSVPDVGNCGAAQGKCTLVIRRCAAGGAGRGVFLCVDLCESGALLCAVCVVFPAGAAAVVYSAMCHGCYAWGQTGIAGDTGVVHGADASHCDDPMDSAPGRGSGDGFFQYPCAHGRRKKQHAAFCNNQKVTFPFIKRFIAACGDLAFNITSRAIRKDKTYGEFFGLCGG